MKKLLSAKSTFIILFLFFAIQSLFAQAPLPAVGDYGSITSGNWNSLTTWKQWDGTGWNTTPTGGPGSSHQTFILTGTTVTYNQDAQKSTSLIIQSGAILKSDSVLQTNGLTVVSLTGSPAVLWVDGTFGSSTDALMIEQRNNSSTSSLTIGGAGTINIAEIRPYSSGLTTPALIFASNVNLNYAGANGSGGAGIYTSRGNITTYTITVNPGVSVNFAANCNFMMSPTVGALGKVSTILNVNGTINMPSSSAIFADSATKSCSINIGNTGIFNIGKYLTPFIPGVNGDGVPAAISIASGGELNILNGGIADFSNPAVSVLGAGTFALKSGGTINIGSSAGLDAANGPVQTSISTFDTSANYNYVGTGSQASGALLPASVNNYSVAASSINNLNSDIKIYGILQINGILNVAKNLTPSLNGNNIAAGGSLNILSGGTADFTNAASNVTGTGTFALKSGGNINIGESAGLDPVNGPVRTTSAVFDTLANYNFVGTGAQSPGALLPSAVNSYSVSATSVDTLNSALRIYGTLLINGVLVNNGGITSNVTATVNGTYQHNLNGGVIPTATWANGSTCLITGTTLGDVNSATTGANQNFYNFTVNCPNLTQPSVPCHFDMANNTIAGNLTFQNTNAKFYALTGYEVTGSPKIITVNGDFILNNMKDSVAIDDYSSSHPVESVELLVKGNLSVTGALGLCVGSAKNLVNLKVMGNVMLETGSQLFSHSGTLDSVIFAGSNIQNYSAGTLSNAAHINFLVPNGSIVNMDTSAFQGGGTFTLNSGGTLISSDTLGLSGNIKVGGTISLSSAANYQFNGSLPQVTGAILPSSVNNLLINNSKGVTLSSNTTISNSLTLANGFLKTTSTSLLTLFPADSIHGVSSSNFINGPLAYVVASTSPTNLVYPIGKDSTYRPVILSVTQDSAKSTTYTSELFNTPPTIKSLAPTLYQLSSVRYYKVSKSAGANVVSDSIRLTYGSDDNVADPSKISIAEGDSLGNWTDLGGVGTAANSGTITSANKFTSFYNFAIGSKSAMGPSLISPISGISNQDTTLKFMWSKLSNAQNYIIQVANDSAFSVIVKNDTVNADSIQLNNFGFGQKYFWRVSGLESSQQTQWSTVWSFSTLLPPPDSLSASIYQNKAVQLTWKNILVNLSGFEIQRKISSSGSFTTIDTAKSNTTTFIDSTVQSGNIYIYKIRSFNAFTTSNFSNEDTINVTLTGINNAGLKPLTFTLQQNYPNPFNPSTQIQYSIPVQSNVKIVIYNILGREVKTLINEERPSGVYTITWNGTDNFGGQVASGVYFYRIAAGTFVQIKKMMLLK